MSPPPYMALRRRATVLAEGRMALLALPAVVFLAVLLFTPLVHLLGLGVASGTFEPYRKAFSDSLYVSIIGLTFAVAAATTIICLMLGYPVAFLLATSRGPAFTLVFIGVLLPFWTSLLVRTYAWMALLGRNGVINRALIDLGLIQEPLHLLYNFGGVLVGTVHVLLPYMILPIYAAMVRVDPDLPLAARGLGAGPFSVLRRVYLPLTMPGIFAGCALVFILSLGAFVTPALLGGGRIVMVANIIQTQVSQFLNWPFAGALSAIVLCLAVGVYTIFGMIARQSQSGAKDGI